MDKRIPFLLAVILISLPSCSGYRSTLLPRVAVSEQFTDNVRLSNENRQSEFVSSVSLGISYALTGQNRELSLSYDPSFVYNSDGQRDFTTRHSATLSATEQITRRSRVLLTDGLVYTNDPATTTEPTYTRVDPPPPAEDTTLRRNNEPYFTNSASARFHHDFGPRDSFDLGYTQRTLRNEDPNIEDSTSNEPSLALTYWLTPKYGLEARSTYTRGDFSMDTDSLNELVTTLRLLQRFTQHLDTFLEYTNTSIYFEGEKQDYQIHDGSIGFDYHISETTFATLNAGYYFQVNDDNGEGGDEGQNANNTSGYVFSGDMAKSFQRGAVRLGGGAGYRQTFFGAENLGFTQYYETTLSGRYDFTSRLNGEVSGSYTNNTYKEIEDREDQIITTTASISYLLRPWLSMSLSFTHRDFDSSIGENSYSENRITLGVSLTPPTPIRVVH